MADDKTDTLSPEKPWLFQPGNPGGGRPKGSIGLRARTMKYLKEHVADEDGTFLKDFYTEFFTYARQRGTPEYKAFSEMALGPDMFDKYDDWLFRGEKTDIAFLHYRLHKESTDIQRQILFSMAKYLFLMAGRRGAKTVGLRQWFADEFIDHADARCLYIGLTSTTAMGLLWTPMLDKFEDLGIKIKAHNRVEGTITTADDGIMKFGGNSTKDEREKNRGPYWDRVGIDECQSQKELRYLIESIIMPTLIDKNGQLACGGTGPRVRGTYWEELFLGARPDGTAIYPDALRLNWNITQNPFIPDYERRLAIIREEENLKETDSLYIREYLGRIAYDDDALVLRLSEQNAFDDSELAAWIASQPVTDVRFSGGLDFGFEDADALAIVCYSVSRPERFLVYEWKANRKGTAEIAEAVRAGLAYVLNYPLFKAVEKFNREHFDIFADTGGNAITPYDLNNTYGIPVQKAYNQEKEMAFELLQDETRRGVFKCRRGGPLWEESLLTVYRRNDKDQLTREIDDDVYHPDAMRAVHYAMRPIQIFGGGK